ncbi:hypothetical protein SLEP1_g29383 [Rubroshorea leprosula]|uniref:Transposase MuDR plant domain-containing protein n=1 Tax=Rubroshorea leprosula TaxID=152421 RepID=A0AAV5K3S1_9ROSI|nr:hypothetical protein SLEP1_g29383 [Rubroshorea leprosula]
MAREIIDIDLEGDSNGSGNEVRFLFTNLILRCVKVMLNGWCHLVIVLVYDECSKKVGKVGFSNLSILTCFLKRGIWSPPYVFFMGQCVYLYGSTPGDDVNKGQETNNAGKRVETEGPTNDFTTQDVWSEKEDEAGVEKERAGASKSDNVADDHNDNLSEDKEAKSDEGHDDPVMDILELADNEDEEAMKARRKVKSFCYNLQEDNVGPSSYHDGGYSNISTDEDDGSDADHASRRRAQHVVYEEVEDALPDIRLGMIFVSKAQFKAIVDKCNMMQIRDIKWKKNDSKRIRAVCKHAPSCDWKILLSKDAVTDSWMVKTYIHKHTYSEKLISKRCNSTSASKYLVEKMGFASFYLKADDIFQTIRRHTRLELTGTQCKKLRRRDLEATILIQAPRPTIDTNPIFMRMRIVARRTFAEVKFVGDFGPKIWEKIVASREGSKRCRVLWLGGTGYEVEEEEKGAASSPPQEQNKKGEAKRKKSGSQLHAMAKDRQGKGGQSGAKE